VNIINHDVEQIEPVVKAFSHEETRTVQVLGGMCDYIRWVKHSMFNITLPMALITMFLEGGIVVMTLVGLSLMSSGELTVTRFIIAFILGGLFSSSFSKLATFQHFAGFNLVVSLFVEYVKGIPVLKIFGIKVKDSYGRISRFLNAPVVMNPKYPKTTERFDISFENIGFHYEKESFEMKNFTFNVPEKTMTALVGSSGSGKTTVTNLLLRFWKPQTGNIRIGGVDIREMDYDYLLSKISVVMDKGQLVEKGTHNQLIDKNGMYCKLFAMQ